MVDHCDLSTTLAVGIAALLSPSPLGVLARKVVGMDFSTLIKDLKLIASLVLEVIPGATVEEKTAAVTQAIDAPLKNELAALGCSPLVIAVADKVIELLAVTIVNEASKA